MESFILLFTFKNNNTDTMRVLLEYIYTDALTSLENVHRVLVAADEYGLERLVVLASSMLICSSFFFSPSFLTLNLAVHLSKTLNPDNMIATFKLAASHNAPFLVQCCLREMSINWLEVYSKRKVEMHTHTRVLFYDCIYFDLGRSRRTNIRTMGRARAKPVPSLVILQSTKGSQGEEYEEVGF